MNNRLCTAFLPWLVFDLVTRTGDGVAFAAAAALITAVAVAFPNLRARTPTTVETTGAVVFALVAIAGVAGAPGPTSLLARGAVPATTGVLAAVMLLSLLRTPATAEYARTCVRPSTAEGPRFAIINMTMSAVWGVAFVLVAGSQAVAAFVGAPHGASVFGWLVPVALLLAVTKATAGLWADYREREVLRAHTDGFMDGLFWDVGPSLYDDEA